MFSQLRQLQLGPQLEFLFLHPHLLVLHPFLQPQPFVRKHIVFFCYFWEDGISFAHALCCALKNAILWQIILWALVISMGNATKGKLK